MAHLRRKRVCVQITQGDHAPEEKVSYDRGIDPNRRENSSPDCFLVRLNPCASNIRDVADPFLVRPAFCEVLLQMVRRDVEGMLTAFRPIALQSLAGQRSVVRLNLRVRKIGMLVCRSLVCRSLVCRSKEVQKTVRV